MFWRYFILGILLTVSTSSSSQDLFAKQLQEIAKDTSRHFKSLYGKRQQKMDIFFAKQRVEGTMNDKLYSMTGMDVYFMEINGSSSKDSASAAAVFEKWTTKLATALGNQYVKATGTWSPGFKAYFVKSYTFSHGHLEARIEHAKRFEGDDDVATYYISLQFTYRYPHSITR